MFARPMTRRRTRIAMAVMLPLAVACSGKESTGPDSNPLVGTWEVTSVVGRNVEWVDTGLSMTLTLTAADTYILIITDDVFETCLPAESCTQTGTYSATATQITLDPGLRDGGAFNYAINGTTMTFNGEIGAVPVTMVWQRK